MTTFTTEGGPHPGTWSWTGFLPDEWKLNGRGAYVRAGTTTVYRWRPAPVPEPCDRHFLRWCADCAGGPRPPSVTVRSRPGPAELAWEEMAGRAHAAAADPLGPWVVARYEGTCRACGDRWEPGDRIRADDEEGGWICEMCGSGRSSGGPLSSR